MYKLHSVLAVFVAPIICGSVSAQLPATIERIDVTRPRTHFASYQETYEVAKKVQEAGHGKVFFGLRLVAARPGVRLDDIQLSLESDTQSVPLSIREGGFFIVPVDDRIAQQKGVYAINKNKGDIAGIGFLAPAIEKSAWTIGAMREVLANAKEAKRAALPWYMKAFQPDINAIAVCVPESGTVVRLMKGDIITDILKVEEKTTDDFDRPVFCRFFRADDNFDDTLRVVMPNGAEVMLSSGAGDRAKAGPTPYGGG